MDSLEGYWDDLAPKGTRHLVIGPDRHGMFRRFVEIDQGTLRSNLEMEPSIVAIFEAIANFYHRIEEGVRDTRDVRVEDRLIPLCLFHESFKFWLNGVAVLLRGHLIEFLPLMRGALESAAYAHKIHRRPELAEVWLQREQRRREFDAAFRDGGIEQQLFPEDEPLVRRLWSLFDFASTFGVHSNHERLAFSIEGFRISNGHAHFDFVFASSDLRMIGRCAGFCTTIAYRMLEVFRPCFEDITGLAVWMDDWPQLERRIHVYLESVQRAEGPRRVEEADGGRG